ncbi:MAG: helix-turn-helix transcriptional regulator [Chthoniobacterales bacterium]
MDDFGTHWGAFHRRFPLFFPLQTLGYFPRKTQWVRQVFATCNFSFIISGGGSYTRNGVKWEVEAPCVITQWPGDEVDYGATGKFDSWEELYLIFRGETREAFERCGFIRDDRPCWPIGRNNHWDEVRDEVIRLGQNPLEKQADRMDRLCERLIFESLLPKESAPEDHSNHAEGIRAIQHILQRESAITPNFLTLAQQHGMSESTFRRQWEKLVGPPPARYLNDLRIREARRQLVETNRSVGEIAMAVGYEDALYFSRKFRLACKVSPTDYRKFYRVEAERKQP